MSKTDRNEIEELFTGEFALEGEPENERDIRLGTLRTFAEEQQRLARAINDLTEYIFAPHVEKPQ